MCVSLEKTQIMMDSATNQRINEVYFKSDCFFVADMSTVACKNKVDGYNTKN